MDYINAAGMFQNQNPVPNNPFWSGYQGGVNQQMAAPFLDQARQSSAYDLQKKAMEMGEFTGPEGVAQRSAARQADTAKSQYTIATQPEMAKTDVMAQQETRRKMPDLTEAEIQKARQAVMNAKSAPAREFVSELGALGDHFDSVPEEQRQGAYDQFINRWHMTHPGAVLPENLRKYSPEIHREMKAIHYASVNTPEQIGKERVAMIGADASLQGKNLEGQYGLAREDIQGRYGLQRAQTLAGIQETPQRAEARLRRELRANPGDQDARRELSGYVEERFNNKFQNDSYGQLLRMQSLNDPSKKKDYLVYREQERARTLMDETHMFGEISPEGRSWVLRAIEANPDAGLENVVAMGRQLGKLGGKGAGTTPAAASPAAPAARPQPRPQPQVTPQLPQPQQQQSQPAPAPAPMPMQPQSWQDDPRMEQQIQNEGREISEGRRQSMSPEIGQYVRRRSEARNAKSLRDEQERILRRSRQGY